MPSRANRFAGYRTRRLLPQSIALAGLRDVRDYKIRLRPDNALANRLVAEILHAVVYTRDLGIIADGSPIRFANPIYREIIPRVLSSPFQMALPTDLADPRWYIKNARLDMEPLLDTFQTFYRRHSETWLKRYDFREVGRQLLPMAFLQRIVNAGGRIEREMAIGNGRCDLLVEYGDQRLVIELKLYRDSVSEQEGLNQTARYLARLGLDRGYLLLFETRPDIPWERRIYRRELNVDGKQIVLLGM